MKSLAVFLPEGFADWEAAYSLAPGRHFFGLSVRSFSAAGDPVRSIGGLVTSVDGAVQTINPEKFDILLLIGSDVWGSKDAPVLTGLIGSFLKSLKPVAAICGATLSLARAGLLDTRKHTSNSLDFLENNAPEYHGKPLYQNAPQAVTDNGVITAPGLAPVSFAAAIFRLLLPSQEDQITSFERLCATEHLYQKHAESKGKS